MLTNLLAKLGEPIATLADMLGDGIWIVAFVALFFVLMNEPKRARRKPWNEEWMA